MEFHAKSKNPPWWNGRIKLVSIAMVTSLLIVAVTFAVFSTSYQKNIDASQPIYVHPRFKRHAAGDEICTTPGCARAAKEIIDFLDERINPCDDFFKFACGGWLEKNTISEDGTKWSVFDEVNDELYNQLIDLMEVPSDGSEPKSVQIVRDLYESCIDLDNIEKLGSAPLEKVLKSFGGWPVVMGDKWNESNFNWMESLFAFREFGFDHMVLMLAVVKTDIKNNTLNSIELDEATMGIDRSYYLNGLNDPVTQAYFNMMVKAAKKLGANEQTVEKELLQVLNFETAIANFTLPPEERRDYDKLYNKMTIPQMRELAPQIDWLKFLNGICNDPITEDETVIVYNPNFVKQVGDLITRTDNRVIANYMMWRVVLQSLPLLSKEWKDIEQEFDFFITGQIEEGSRLGQCVSFISQSLSIALSSYYVKYNFQADSKHKATEMVEYLRKEFLNILEEVDWMNDDTRNEAKEKAEAIIAYVGYPQELSNDTLVSQIYKDLTITNDDYFDNYMNLVKWAIDDNISKLRKPNKKGNWRDHANVAIVNAFYKPVENSIGIPAGILQNALFNKDRPNYMNFGAIGFVIGHEVTHGFDDTGKQFDKDGNNRNWWDEVTDERFKEKAKCIIHQYGNYTTDTGLQLNGINTQGENIADNGGLKQAFKAYHSWVRDHKPEGRLPGLKYTTNQLFFISSANVWCGKYRPEQLKLTVLSDVHSPFEFRVKGPMSNSKEFSAAFGCPLGSEMNPEKKCEVW